MRIIRLLILGTMIAAGSLLLFAAFAKAVDPRETVRSLAFVFGQEAAPPLTRVLILYEVVLGVFLLLCVYPRIALGAFVFTLLGFGAWIGALEAMDAPVGCGCGISGSGNPSDSGRFAALMRVAVLLLLGATALVGTLFMNNQRGGVPLHSKGDEQ